MPGHPRNRTRPYDASNNADDLCPGGRARDGADWTNAQENQARQYSPTRRHSNCPTIRGQTLGNATRTGVLVQGAGTSNFHAVPYRELARPRSSVSGIGETAQSSPVGDYSALSTSNANDNSSVRVQNIFAYDLRASTSETLLVLCVRAISAAHSTRISRARSATFAE